MPGLAILLLVVLVGVALGLRRFLAYAHTYTGTAFNPDSLQSDKPTYYYLDWRRDLADLDRIRSLQDEDGLLDFGTGVEIDGRIRRDPMLHIQICLGLHDQLLDAHCEERDAVLRRQVDWLLSDATEVLPGGIPVWPQYMRGDRYRMPPPWISALTQGQAMSLLVRMASYLGDDSLADRALRAARAFTEPGFPIVWRGDDGDVFLEEYPCEPPSHVLNGCLFAWLGAWDVVRYTGDAELAAFCRSSLECIEARTPTYELGDWTRYDVLQQRPTSPVYQEIHAALAEAMFGITQESFWGERAQRWRAAARNPLLRSRVFVSVLAGKVADRRRHPEALRGYSLDDVTYSSPSSPDSSSSITT
jgi:hypothetical protein